MKLYYFTNSFPYGIGEQWKSNELNELVNYFDQIILIPYSYGGNKSEPKPLSGKITLCNPLFENDKIDVSKLDIFLFIFHSKRVDFFREFFTKKVYLTKQRLISWFVSTKRSILLLRHPLIKSILAEDLSKSNFYFYWGKGCCEFLPFIDTKKLNKSFVRMHRYDLFEYVNNGYIPYRKLLLEKITIAAPTSEAGKKHLVDLYPQSEEKIKVFRCGTINQGGNAKGSTDGILRIISCSLLSPVKRVNLMIESLNYINFPVEWHHIGDGALKNDLQQLVADSALQDKFFFHGFINSDKILDFYTQRPFDLFINVSESEGVPFSIMEAFSVGIPVLATNAGGTGEIVDELTGTLLEVDISAHQLANAITDFNNLTNDRKHQKRLACLDRYQSNCNAKLLARELGEYLSS